MSLEDTLRVLDRTPMFAEIGRDAARLLAFSAEEVQLRAGERLFQRGTPAEGAFVILDGRLRLVARGRQASEREVGPGTLIGEMALLVPTERPCDAVAAEATRLLSIPRPLFRRVLEELPELAGIVARHLAERTRREEATLEAVRQTMDALTLRRLR